MASERRRRGPWPVALALAYGLAVMGWGLFRDPLGPAEARTIFIGREVLAHGPPSCAGPGPSSAIERLACAEPGSAVLAPAAIALADSAGGFRGARLLGAMLGLVLIVLVSRTAATSPHGGSGSMAAAAFVLLGLPLPLAASALPRIHSAVLLAAGLLLLEGAAVPGAERRPVLRLPLAAAALALAVATSYVAVLFAAPIALLVLIRHRLSLASLAFLLALALALGAYAFLGVRPAWAAIRAGLEPAWREGVSPPRLGQLVNWLSMPYLLATFGLFHRRGGRSALVMMVLAACAFLVPLWSARAEDQGTAALVALAVLAPAAALGVERMGEIFSSNNTMALVRPFFTAAVLVVVAAFGLQEAKGLRREQPDLSGAVRFLLGRGPPGMTVAVESDYGAPEYLYRYHLEGGSPPARVVPVARATDGERRALLASLRPDYAVLDEHHSDRSFARASGQYLAAGYAIAASWPLALPAGVKTLRVLARDGRAGP